MHLGQQAMITGDHRVPLGVMRVIAKCPAEDRNGRVRYYYQVEPRHLIDGLEVYFREDHLTPLDDEVTSPGELMELTFPENV